MTDNYLVGEKSGNIYTITLNRPEKRNAIMVEMLTGICEMAESQSGDPDIRAIILKGEGKIFSAGVDFNSLGAEVGACLGEAGAGGAPLRALIYRFQQYFNRLEAVEIPIICAMHGRALGLGIELALACDIRLASTGARMGFPEVGLGIFPGFGGTQRVTRLVGKGRACELIFTGDQIDAEEAACIGLVNRVAAPQQLMAEARRLARRIARQGPIAVARAKTAINQALQVGLDAGLAFELEAVTLTFGTEDQNEGMTAFVERRRPKFKGQ